MKTLAKILGILIIAYLLGIAILTIIPTMMS